MVAQSNVPRPAPAPDRSDPPSLQLLALALGCALAVLVLQWTIGGETQDFGELALGATTTSLYATLDGHRIHCTGVADAPECLAGVAARGNRPVVLWLGNSQLHAVNQLRPREENAPPIVARRLRKLGVDLVAFSQPNANLQEHLTLFSYLRPRLPIRALVLPVVFDDLREVGLRTDIAAAIGDPEVLAALRRHEIGRRILASQKQQGEGDLAALHDTTQEASEAALEGWLAQHSELWALRPQARGKLFEKLYNTRNAVFGIDAQSKRRMIPGRTQLNLDAAEALLAEARAAGIPVLVYVVPLRDDIETPYVETEYREFKDFVRDLARKNGAAFLNLEHLVPAQLWGETIPSALGQEADLDFMHFQAGGHELLAREIGDMLVRMLSEPSS